MNPDPRSWRGLYAIIDVEACGARAPEEVAAAVLAGGCAALQLRAKHGDASRTRSLARALQALCRKAGVPFVLNDYVALAAELGADGVHLGQSDMAMAHARALAPSTCIGLSTHSLAQASAAEQLGANLIGFGPVFATRNKQSPDPVVGVGVLTELMARAHVPVVAIGGIDLTNIGLVAATGVPLVACIGAICKTENPQAVAAALHARVAG